MRTAELATLADQVLWAAFFVAMCFGAAVQRSGFCAMGVGIAIAAITEELAF